MPISNSAVPIWKSYQLNNEDWYLNKRMSGSTPLGIAYKIPFVLPHTYRAHADLNKYSEFYQNYEELVIIIDKMYQEKVKGEILMKNFETDYPAETMEKDAKMLYELILR